MKKIILAILALLSWPAFAQTSPENFTYGVNVNLPSAGLLNVQEMLTCPNGGATCPPYGIFSTTVNMYVQGSGTMTIALNPVKQCITTRVGCVYYTVTGFVSTSVTDSSGNVVGQWAGESWSGSVTAGTYTLVFVNTGEATWRGYNQPDTRNFLTVTFQ